MQYTTKAFGLAFEPGSCPTSPRHQRRCSVECSMSLGRQCQCHVAGHLLACDGEGRTETAWRELAEGEGGSAPLSFLLLVRLKNQPNSWTHPFQPQVRPGEGPTPTTSPSAADQGPEVLAVGHLFPPSCLARHTVMAGADNPLRPGPQQHLLLTLLGPKFQPKLHRTAAQPLNHPAAARAQGPAAPPLEQLPRFGCKSSRQMVLLTTWRYLARHAG